MNRVGNYRFALASLAAVLVAATLAQSVAGQAGRGTRLRGRVVRVQAPNQFVVRTADNRDLVLFTNPQTKYIHPTRAVGFANLRQGVEVDAVYDLAGRQNVVSALTLVDAAATTITPAAPPAPAAPAGGGGSQLVGRVTKAHSDPNHLVLTTPDNKEAVLYLDNREFSVRYEVRDGKKVIVALTTAGAAALPPPAPAGETTVQSSEPAVLQGTVVRLVGNDQIVVRTAAGEEVTVYGQPVTTYTVDNRAARFADFQPGMEIRVNYDLRDRRHFARSVLGFPRRR